MAGPANRIYVIDASSWITIEGHPAQNRILYYLSKLIEARKVICPPEVWHEVQRAPYLKAWLASYDESFVRRISDAEYYLTAGRVTHRFPVMAAARANREKGDQWVVAMASYLNAPGRAQHYVAVSEEGFQKRQTIPKACAAFNVPHTDLFGMLQDEFPDEGF